MELNDSSRAAGSSHPAIPSSVFPGSLGKLLPLPAAQVPTRLSPPRPASSPAPAAGYADFVGAANSNTAPTVAKPALFRQRVPWTNFPAWPGQPIVQPMFVEKSALPIFPDEPAAAQICAADFPPCWHGCRGPPVWANSLFRQSLDRKSFRLINSACCRFCRLPTLPISPALPNQPTLSRGLPLPQCLNQRCFVSVSPGRIFLPGLDSPSSSPCSSKNLRCRFSPTNPQLLKSALPIFPLVGMAAAAPLSGPTVFSVKPWTVNRPDS